MGRWKKIVDFGYQVVEPAGYPGSNAKQATQWFDELGLPVGDGRERVLEEAETVGCSTIISGFGPDDFKTVDGVKRKCAILNEAAQEAKKAGRRIGYHNHWWEFSMPRSSAARSSLSSIHARPTFWKVWQRARNTSGRKD